MFGTKSTYNCEYATAAVEYVYGEMSAARTDQFESHLAGCDACIAEIAAVSEARFEVFEWRKLAFDPLKTPAIRIPYAEPIAARVGLAGRLFQLFTPARLAAGGAFAAAFVALLTWLAFSAADPAATGTTLAGNTSPAPAAPVMEVTSVDSTSALQPRLADELKPDRAISTTRAVQAKAKAPVRVAKPQLAMDKQPAQRNTVRRNTAPTLSGYAAEEDSSLRLAQVFDEIGSSD
jgi:anti-sigma factor RsiW